MRRPDKNPMLYEVRGMRKQQAFSVVAPALWNCLSGKYVPRPPSWHFTKLLKLHYFTIVLMRVDCLMAASLGRWLLIFILFFCTLLCHSESNNVASYQNYKAEQTNKQTNK